MEKSRKIGWIPGKRYIAGLFLLFSTPFVYVAEGFASFGPQTTKTTAQSGNDSKPHWKAGKKRY